MELLIIDFLDNKHNTGIELDSIDYIEVEVITGDEVLNVVLKDGSTNLIDASDFNVPRSIDFHDGFYIVQNKDLEKWNKRENSYSYIDLIEIGEE